MEIALIYNQVGGLAQEKIRSKQVIPKLLS